MNPGSFKSGDDNRRNLGGRAPSSRSMSASIRKSVGRNLQTVLDKTSELAAQGNPEAILASAILIAATLDQGGKE